MQELWLLCSAHCLMLTDIYMKFCEDTLNGFQVKEQTQVWQGGETIGRPTLKRGDVIFKMVAILDLQSDWFQLCLINISPQFF